MKSISLVLPYFGKFPNYFQLFLESCKNNPSIDWLIYTDDHTEYEYPANVKVTYCTFADFRARVQKNFDFKITLDKPYKLCDYKPAYGEILADDLKNYDYWGYCDCDLIFGNIRHFLTDNVLLENDKIFSRGHCSIYKNTPIVNRFYREQKYLPVEEIYTNSKAYCFDEWGG